MNGASHGVSYVSRCCHFVLTMLAATNHSNGGGDGWGKPAATNNANGGGDGWGQSASKLRSYP